MEADNPILNSTYDEPLTHHATDGKDQQYFPGFIARVKVDAAPSPPSESGEGAASTALRTYFDPAEPVGFVKGGNLPHWRQGGATYFVTWRTADSMPRERVDQWLREREEWLAAHPEPHDIEIKAEYDRLFPARWEQWLDEGHGERLLARQEIREIVERTLRRFEVDATPSSRRSGSSGGEATSAAQYRLDDFTVMPNHVHVLVTPMGDHRLSEIAQAWKSVSAHAINRALGRTSSFWQKESFDHIVRNADQMARFRQYIRDNRGH